MPTCSGRRTLSGEYRTKSTRRRRRRRLPQEPKAKIAADVAAKRAELEARREKLEDHIQAMNSGLKSEIRELNFRLELAGLTARSGIATGIDNLHRQVNHYNDELERLLS